MSRERDLVHAAVLQGVGSPPAIATWVGITVGRVHTELGRLSDLRKIRRNGLLWEPMPASAPTPGTVRVVRLMDK